MINIPMNTKGPVSLSSIQPSQSVEQRQVRSGVVLKKGQKTNLVTSSGSPLGRLRVGLYWDVSGSQVDLDASCFLLGQNGKVIGDDWFVFYGQLHSPDNSVNHSGDCVDGSMPEDDEVISIDLQCLNTQVTRLVFVVTINEARERGLNFSSVRAAGVHVQDADTGIDLCQFKLEQFYSNVTSMMVGEVYRHNGGWKFNPVGDGIEADLYGLCARYGVNVLE